MLRSITAQQFFEWIAYAALEPFDETRDDVRTASIVQTVVNMGRDVKKHPTPVSLSECVLHFGDIEPKKPRQTWQEQKEIARMLTAQFKG